MSESNNPQGDKTPEQGKSPEQIEQERLTRRQALRKFGFGAGLSAFMLLGVNDLARMVGAELQKRAGDSKVADLVAREFQEAGLALASGGGCTPSGTNCTGCVGESAISNCCQHSSNPDLCCNHVGNAQPPGWNQHDVCLTCCQDMHPGSPSKFTACLNQCPPPPQ